MNESKVRSINQETAHRRFIQALSAGQVGAYDRLQQPIQVGVKVLWSPPYDLIYDVTSVAPVLDPGAPAGLMNVTLTVTATVQMAANQPNPQFLNLPFLRPAAQGQALQGSVDHGSDAESGEGGEASGGSLSDPDCP